MVLHLLWRRLEIPAACSPIVQDVEDFEKLMMSGRRRVYSALKSRVRRKQRLACRAHRSATNL